MLENQQNGDLFEIHVNHESRGYFYEMAKWCKFLSIVGFIGIGLMVVGGLTLGMLSKNSLVSYMPSATLFVSLFYVIFALLYFYPIFCMYKFSTLMKKGLNENNQTMFNEGLSNLKAMFKFMGILTIVMLVAYALFIIMLGLTGVASSL